MTATSEVLTPDEYLALERRAQFRSEYCRARMSLRAVCNRWHNLVSGNVLTEVGNQLRDRTCEVFSSNMRIKVVHTGLYAYPDGAIVCGRPQFDDEVRDTLLNPTVLFEVLSKSTEAYDRGVKAAQYRPRR